MAEVARAGQDVGPARRVHDLEVVLT